MPVTSYTPAQLEHMKKVADAHEEAKAKFDKLARFDCEADITSNIPTDLHDLYSGKHARGAMICWGAERGLTDVVVIWYKDEAVCVSWDDFMDEYRILDVTPPRTGWVNRELPVNHWLSTQEAAQQATLASIAECIQSHTSSTKGENQ